MFPIGYTMFRGGVGMCRYLIATILNEKRGSYDFPFFASVQKLVVKKRGSHTFLPRHWYNPTFFTFGCLYLGPKGSDWHLTT